MNSCMSRPLLACAPPFMMFIMGTGSTLALAPPRYLYKGSIEAAAAALATAMETPRIAFAPSFFLLSVPSSSIIVLSMSTWSVASMPRSSLPIFSRTFLTAFCTPLPRYLFLSPSRSSTASNLPVDGA